MEMNYFEVKANGENSKEENSIEMNCFQVIAKEEN